MMRASDHGTLRLKRYRLRTGWTFTLIEMLVVISIIAILASMLMPSLIRARDLGQKVSCISNLRQIGILMSSYGNDFNGYAPPGRYILFAGIQRTFFCGLAGYAALPEATGYLQYVTPMMLDSDGRNAKFTSRTQKTIFVCPADPYPEPEYQFDFAISYGINYSRMADEPYPGYLPQFKVNSLRSASRCAAVADTQGYLLTGERHMYFGYTASMINYGSNHAGTGNYLYFAGNVGTLSPVEVPLPPGSSTTPFWRGM